MSISTTQDAIVLFGDSITQGSWDVGGFAQQLAYVYCRKMDIVNRGFGGYNSAWAIPLFKQIFAKKANQASLPKCKLLTIWFGANDSVHPGGRQHVPLEAFKANLKWMIQALRNPESEYYSPSTRIILITPPPIHEASWSKWLTAHDPPLQLDRDTENTKAYAEATKAVAAAERVPVVDTWSAIWDAAKHENDNLTSFLSDGLHLTKEGYDIVYKELIKVIGDHIPELHYDRLAQLFPAWDAIDTNDLEGSIVSHYVDV